MKIIFTVLLSFITLFSFSQDIKNGAKKKSEKEKMELMKKKREGSKINKNTTLKEAARLKANPKAPIKQDRLNQRTILLNKGKKKSPRIDAEPKQKVKSNSLKKSVAVKRRAVNDKKTKDEKKAKKSLK